MVQGQVIIIVLILEMLVTVYSASLTYNGQEVERVKPKNGKCSISGATPIDLGPDAGLFEYFVNDEYMWVCCPCVFAPWEDLDIPCFKYNIDMFKGNTKGPVNCPAAMPIPLPPGK